jgi:hypothetical protein
MQPNASTDTAGLRPLKVIKRTGIILTSDILDVMRGRAAALHIKGAASRETCEKIVDNFDRNNGVLERRDGVPGRYIGSSHFKKSAAEYFSESTLNRPHISALLGDVVDPIRAVFSLLTHKLEEDGRSLRLAAAEEGRANYCRALCWTGTGQYALKPHDDVAQVEHAGEGYEFTAAARHEVVAVNFYPSMPQHGGDLRIWNYKPTMTEKLDAGLEKTGYPYAEPLLADKEYWDLGVSTGDLLLLNGGYVHGVTRQSNEGRRVLLHAFVGFVNDNDAVWWT